MPVLALRTTSATEWPDQVLLRRVLRRDQRAWNELIRRYRPLMYRCITRASHKLAANINNADIDEIYAESLLSLCRNNMRKLRQFDPERGARLSTWLGMISINATHDFLRVTRRIPEHIRLEPWIEERMECLRTSLDTVLDRERWRHLGDLLEDFSQKDRLFLRLYYGQGMAAEEVATSMAINLKTVYSKKHKIRAHLRRNLQRKQRTSALADLLAAAA
jgi:RNA polymerase sigma-70 factor (ECF subfamily)